MSEDSITLQKIPQKSLSALLVDAIYNAPPLWCQSSILFLDSLPLDEHAVDWRALNGVLQVVNFLTKVILKPI